MSKKNSSNEHNKKVKWAKKKGSNGPINSLKNEPNRNKFVQMSPKKFQ